MTFGTTSLKTKDLTARLRFAFYRLLNYGYLVVKRLFFVFIAVSLALVTASCTNISGASKSSTSLTSFLGFSELPDWYITSNYSYADSKWAENDFGLPIHYRDVGEGPVLILLHGEISSLHTWEAWIDVLAQDFRVIAIDLPGSGLTGVPNCIDNPKKSCPENLTLDYIQHTLEYFIDDLNIDQFTLVGSSYGGYLAAQYTLEHPNRLDKLVLISPMGFQQEVPWVLNYITASGMDFFNSFIQPASIISSIVDDFYGERDNLKQVNLERYIHLAQSEGAHRTNVLQLKLVRNIMERGMPTSLEEIKAKTLIMWGEYDTWGNSDHADRWEEELSDATLVKYPFFGHIPMEESPENTVVDIVAFMNGDPLPTIEGLGIGGSFTIEEAASELDKEALFGTPKPSDQQEDPHRHHH